MNKNIQLLIQRIIEQVILVQQRDSFLFIPPRAYEPSIAHKVAQYLQSVFPKHDIDIEYDKYGGDKKKELENFKKVCTDNSTDRIRPDIIVHQRGFRVGNVLALEIKDCRASRAARLCVDEKLKRLTERKERFGYSLGILWLFGKHTSIEKTKEFFFYINGERYDDINIVAKILGDYEVECRKRFENVKKLVFERIMQKSELEQLQEDSYDDDKISDGIFLYENEEEEEWEEGYEPESSNESISEDEESKAEAVFYNQAYKDAKKKYVQKALDDYNDGKLCDKDISYESSELSANESRKKWKTAWNDLHFLSTNSLISNHLYCVMMQKRLLDIALESDPVHKYLDDSVREYFVGMGRGDSGILNIFSDTRERNMAEEHRRFLTA